MRAHGAQVVAAWPAGAVFDLDGLLVDTQACWNRTFEIVANAAVPESGLAGVSAAGAAAVLGVDRMRLEAVLLDQVSAARPSVLPGVLTLLTRLSDRFPLALASNGPRAVVAHLLEELALECYFDAVVCVDDVSRPKPAPDVYLEACRPKTHHPGDVIAFEDSSLGAQAALAAGAVVIGVPPAGRALPEADLTVGRLDDPQVLRLLDVHSADAHDGNQQAIEDICRQIILEANAQAWAQPGLRTLAGDLLASLLRWRRLRRDRATPSRDS